MEQQYTVPLNGSFAVNANGQVIDVNQLRGTLEQLSGEGEEAIISKAKIRLQIFTSREITTPASLVVTPCLMVADSAIASAAAAAATYDLDELLDPGTAGNFEFRKLSRPVLPTIKNVSYIAGPVQIGLHSVTLDLDITVPVRKAAKRLIRSPILTTTPEIEIVLAIPAGCTTTTWYFTGFIEYQYVSRPRPARMI